LEVRCGHQRKTCPCGKGSERNSKETPHLPTDTKEG